MIFKGELTLGLFMPVWKVLQRIINMSNIILFRH